MDEPEPISRRDAAVGLSILGTLTLAVVGTIVFRIMDASPRRGAPSAEPAWASNAPAARLPEPVVLPNSDRHLVSESLPEVAPIPIAADDEGNIPAATTSEAPVAERQEQAPPDQRPRFVAPAGR